MNIVFANIESDEFSNIAKNYCPSTDLQHFSSAISILDELAGNTEIDSSDGELYSMLKELGNFSAELYFSLKTPTKQDVEESTEKKYRYDVRILNVLATTGLKASSIAHELKNDRNSVSVNYQYIVEALKEYGFWEDLCSQE